MEYEPDTEFTPEDIPEAVLPGTQTISGANDTMLCLITKAFNDCKAYSTCPALVRSHPSRTLILPHNASCLHSMRKETVIPAVSSFLHMFF